MQQAPNKVLRPTLDSPAALALAKARVDSIASEHRHWAA